MSNPAVIIDVADPRLLEDHDDERRLLVYVEPVYDCVAVAAALDAGWSSVELAELAVDVSPIPIISFEQPPSDGAERCRVRGGWSSTQLRPGMVLGAPVLARPLCAQIAFRLDAGRIDAVTFVPALVPGMEASSPVSAAAWWASGMLIRVLLDELERDSMLTDAAGIAVTLATGAEDAGSQLSTGARWHHHLTSGGHEDDLRIAAAIDSFGVVPAVERDGDVLIARPWG